MIMAYNVTKSPYKAYNTKKKQVEICVNFNFKRGTVAEWITELQK